MITSLDNAILQTVSNTNACAKLLDSDGITTKNLVLRNYDNSILINCKDVKKFKEIYPLTGVSFAIIKNLDEYQYILCKYIPEIKDSDFYKIKFQKIRILIYVFFKHLSHVLINLTSKNKRNTMILDKMNKLGNSLLLEISEMILEYRQQVLHTDIAKTSNINNFLQKIKLKNDYFISFEIQEKSVDNVLFSMYGIE